MPSESLLQITNFLNKSNSIREYTQTITNRQKFQLENIVKASNNNGLVNCGN